MATNGRRPYGQHDTDLSKGDHSPQGPTPPGNPSSPPNSYRDTGKRLGATTGSLDTGARRYGPLFGRFFQSEPVKSPPGWRLPPA